MEQILALSICLELAISPDQIDFAIKDGAESINEDS
jgi:hypothetical protein